MKAGLRLLLNVLAWFLAMPVIFAAAGAIKGHRIDWLTGHIAPITAVVLLAWATVIYWRCVPAAPSVWLRLVYLAAFLASMLMLGWGAMWVTYVVMLAIYGA